MMLLVLISALLLAETPSPNPKQLLDLKKQISEPLRKEQRKSRNQAPQLPSTREKEPDTIVQMECPGNKAGCYPLLKPKKVYRPDGLEITK